MLHQSKLKNPLSVIRKYRNKGKMNEGKRGWGEGEGGRIKSALRPFEGLIKFLTEREETRTN
jgi:hypothetical protein